MKNTFYYQNFIFDLDGTLVDSIQDIANAVNYAFSIYSLPKRALEEFPDYLGDGSVNLIKRALKDICVSNEKFHEIFNTYYQYYMKISIIYFASIIYFCFIVKVNNQKKFFFLKNHARTNETANMANTLTANP